MSVDCTDLIVGLEQTENPCEHNSEIVGLPNARNVLTSWGNTEFPERSLHHGVACLVRTFQKASCDDRKPQKLLKNEVLLREIED